MIRIVKPEHSDGASQRPTNPFLFYGAVALILLTCLTPDSAEPWREGTFIVLAAALTLVRCANCLTAEGRKARHLGLLAPIFAITAFSLIQVFAGVFAGASAAANSVGGGVAPPPLGSADPFGTIQFVLRLLSLAVIADLLLRLTDTARRLWLLTHAVLFICIGAALFGLAQQTVTADSSLASLFPYAGADGAYGLAGNRNHFAYLMEMGAGLCAGLVACRGVERQWRALYAAGGVTICVALVSSSSRGGVLSLLGLTLFTAVFAGKVWASGKRRGLAPSLSVRRVASFAARGVLAAGLVLAVGIGVVIIGGDQLGTRLDQLDREVAAAGEDAPPPVRRQEIWEASWQLFKRNPVTGVGFGGYWVAVSQHHVNTGELLPYQAHNDYLEIMASGGAVGAALFAWLFAGVIWRARGELRKDHPFRRAACFGALAGMVGVAIHSAVDFGLHALPISLLFVTLTIIAAADVTQRARRAVRRAGPFGAGASSQAAR